MQTQSLFPGISAGNVGGKDADSSLQGGIYGVFRKICPGTVTNNLPSGAEVRTLAATTVAISMVSRSRFEAIGGMCDVVLEIMLGRGAPLSLCSCPPIGGPTRSSRDGRNVARFDRLNREKDRSP